MITSVRVSHIFPLVIPVASLRHASMLVLPTTLLSLLSAPHPLLPTTARARPVALSVATWDELEAQLPSSLAPEPLIIDSALVHDRVNMHAILRARRLAPASCEPRVPEAQGRLPRRASL